jgi:hypothetical protein
MSLFRSVPASNPSVKKAHFSFSTMKSLLISSCLLLTLAACGGGGSSASGNFDGTGGPAPGTGGGGGVPPAPTPAAYKIGTGSGGTYQDGIISASDTDLEAGEAITLRVNVVTAENEVPTAPFTISFTSPCVATGLAVLGTQTIVTQGLFSITYTNNGCSGEDIVTARIVENGDTATVKLTLREAQVLSVSFVSTTANQLSLAGIGGNETAELTFKVTGAQGSAVAGKLVNFTINSQVGGASILAGRESGLTDQNGEVRTILKSGTIAGPVNVKAIHAETGRQGLSGDITISTGVAESSRFSMSYSPQNPPKAFNTDGITVSITIIASDAFGNNPPDGTRVSFVAPESGNIENSCALVDGACTVTWRSSAPRPADGRLEVIAYTDGAEDFVDRNGNSVYDIQDLPGLDLGEPFADENENGMYDQPLGEYFFDTNQNGVKDTGNGLWDGPCLSKVDSSAICTGNDTVIIYSTVTIVMSNNTADIFEFGDFPAVGDTISVSPGTSLSLGDLFLADSNILADAAGGNPLPLGTTLSFALQGTSTGLTLENSSTETIPNTIYPTGPYGATIVAAPVATSTGARLVLTVQVPGVSARQFSWPIEVTP